MPGWDLEGAVAVLAGLASILGIVIAYLAWRHPIQPEPGDVSWIKRRRHLDLLAFQCLHCGKGGLAIVGPAEFGYHLCVRCGREVSIWRDHPWIHMETEGVPMGVRKRATLSWLGTLERVHAVEPVEAKRQREKIEDSRSMPSAVADRSTAGSSTSSLRITHEPGAEILRAYFVWGLSSQRKRLIASLGCVSLVLIGGSIVALSPDWRGGLFVGLVLTSIGVGAQLVKGRRLYDRELRKLIAQGTHEIVSSGASDRWRSLDGPRVHSLLTRSDEDPSEWRMDLLVGKGWRRVFIRRRRATAFAMASQRLLQDLCRDADIRGRKLRVNAPPSEVSDYEGLGFVREPHNRLRGYVSMVRRPGVDAAPSTASRSPRL